MKRPSYPPRSQALAFTLIELLVVIAIIGILAAILLPTLNRIAVARRIAQAKLDIALVGTALAKYEAEYGRFPISSTAQTSVLALPGGPEDFTFGGTFNTPVGPYSVAASGTYKASNAEIIAVLLDLETFPDGTPTINRNHVKNTQRTIFLSAKIVGDAKSPGIGTDGVFRDPWGNPYIITLDLSNDARARDALYSTPEVSEDPTDPNTPKRGLNGLIRSTDSRGKSVFEANNPIMIWSAGPDKQIDPNPGAGLSGKANSGVNKDNILSWK